nr:YozQ family protein [Brevibacillus laterosporus]
MTRQKKETMNEKTTSNQFVTKSYDINDYQSNDTQSKGLAGTHEQVSDSYAMGTVEGANIREEDNEDIIRTE